MSKKTRTERLIRRNLGKRTGKNSSPILEGCARFGKLNHRRESTGNAIVEGDGDSQNRSHAQHEKCIARLIANDILRVTAAGWKSLMRSLHAGERGRKSCTARAGFLSQGRKKHFGRDLNEVNE